MVIESNNNNDNITFNKETKKDGNIKPVFSMVEETTSLCFVSENNQNESKKENEQQSIKDNSNQESVKNDNLINEHKEENNSSEEIKTSQEKNEKYKTL